MQLVWCTPLSSSACGVTKMFRDATRSWLTLIFKVWVSSMDWAFSCSTFTVNTDFLFCDGLFFKMFICISETHRTVRFLLWAWESRAQTSALFGAETPGAPVVQTRPWRGESSVQPKALADLLHWLQVSQFNSHRGDSSALLKAQVKQKWMLKYRKPNSGQSRRLA